MDALLVLCLLEKKKIFTKYFIIPPNLIQFKKLKVKRCASGIYLRNFAFLANTRL